MQIDKTIIMGDLLRMAPGAADILQAHGMGCIFCPCAQAEALGEAAEVHGVDADILKDRVDGHISGNHGRRGDRVVIRVHPTGEGLALHRGGLRQGRQGRAILDILGNDRFIVRLEDDRMIGIALHRQ